MRSLIHPRMLSRLGNFAQSVCNIQQRPTAEPTATDLDDYGHDIRAFADVPGLQGLRCVFWPVGSSEARSDDPINTKDTATVEIMGYYPSITTDMVAIVGGTTYEIVGVQSDSQHVLTYLYVEEVSL